MTLKTNRAVASIGLLLSRALFLGSLAILPFILLVSYWIEGNAARKFSTQPWLVGITQMTFVGLVMGKPHIQPAN